MHSSALTVPNNRLQKNLGSPYLRVEFGGQQVFAALPMEFIQEVVVLPLRQITTMPNKPACLLGLTNRRSRILWVVDLAQLLGLGQLPDNKQQYSVVIMQVGAVPLGLAVHQVNGITWIQPGEVQAAPGNLAPGLLPYVMGCWIKAQELVLLLEARAIAHAPALHAE